MWRIYSSGGSSSARVLVLCTSCPRHEIPERGTFSWFVMKYYFGAGWDEGVSIKIVCSMEVHVSRERGVDAGGLEKVKC